MQILRRLVARRTTAVQTMRCCPRECQPWHSQVGWLRRAMHFVTLSLVSDTLPHAETGQCLLVLRRPRRDPESALHLACISAVHYTCHIQASQQVMKHSAN